MSDKKTPQEYVQAIWLSRELDWDGKGLTPEEQAQRTAIAAWEADRRKLELVAMALRDELPPCFNAKPAFQSDALTLALKLTKEHRDLLDTLL